MSSTTTRINSKIGQPSYKDFNDSVNRFCENSYAAAAMIESANGSGENISLVLAVSDLYMLAVEDLKFINWANTAFDYIAHAIAHSDGLITPSILTA